MSQQLNRRNILQGAGATALAVTGLFKPAIAKTIRGTGELVVFDGGGVWGEAQRKAYFEPFERETGIKVIRNPRVETGAVRASILAGAPRYDVAVAAGGVTPGFERDGLLLPIDYQYFEKEDLEAFTPIATSKYTCPHIVYSLISVYSKAAFPNGAPKTWADVWDVKRFPGKRTLAGGTWGPTAAAYEIALLADGVDPAKLYPIDWDRAFKSLERIKPSILKWWTSGAETSQLLIDKQAVIGSAWNGRVFGAIEEGANLGVSWDQGIIQYDNWYVLKGAKNAENAMKFLGFSARADRQAEFAKHILYSPPNANAFKLIDPARAALLPTNEKVRGLQIVQNYDFWSQQTKGQDNERYAVSQWEAWISGVR